ncbi:MAG: hypothetical protein P4L53_13280 [Candidatus Obscuribacterales bacterium]|nr:hypothetical protein [Candidatus Obscuribacterales bacterium]
MSETVSKPNHHSDKVPTKEERDAAYSNDGGRKAIEEPIDQIEKESCEAPIGLDTETKAERCDAKPQSCDSKAKEKKSD